MLPPPVASSRKSLWAAVAISLCVCLIAAHGSGFTLAEGSFLKLTTYIVTIAIALSIDPARFGRLQWLATAADALLLFATVSAVGAVASYVGMQHSGAFTDPLLDEFDTAIGFHWPSLRAAAEHHPVAMIALDHAYSACFSMPVLIAGLLAGLGHAVRLYRYLAVHVLALTMTIVTAFFFPARAAFAFYDHAAVPDNAARYGDIILGLRNGSLTTIDLNALGGIITFPSFHATMAITFAWALWPIRAIRIPVVAINTLMWIAAVPIGGHYVVDLLGGSAIAIVAILLTARLRFARFAVHTPQPCLSAGLTAV